MFSDPAILTTMQINDFLQIPSDLCIVEKHDRIAPGDHILKMLLAWISFGVYSSKLITFLPLFLLEFSCGGYALLVMLVGDLGKRNWIHYKNVIMTVVASQITSLTIVYSSVYSGAGRIKHLSSASLAFVRGIYRWPVNSSRKGPVTRKMFPLDDITMKKKPGVDI